MKYEKLQLDYNGDLYDVTRTKTFNQQENTEHEVVSDELIRVKNDITEVRKMRDILEKKILTLTQEKDGLSNDCMNRRRRIGQIEKQIDEFKKLLLIFL